MFILSLALIALILCLFIWGEERSLNFILSKIQKEEKTLKLSKEKKKSSSIPVHIAALVIFSCSFILLNLKIDSTNNSLLISSALFIVFHLRVHQARQKAFQNEVLEEVNELCSKIQIHLNQGRSLDSSFRLAAEQHNFKIIQKDLKIFFEFHSNSILDNLCSFLESLSNKFKIKVLGKSIRILELDIKFSNNQDKAFEDFNKYFIDNQESQKKLSNSYKLILFSLDFMIFFYFLNLLFIIPSTLGADNSWWHSEAKNIDILFSSIGFWTVYLFSLFLLHKKEGNLE